MSKTRCIIFGVLCVLLVVAQAEATTVTDVYLDDLNKITGSSQDDITKTFTIDEIYGEDNRIGYPSHDGMAIVDYDRGESVRFFDKVFDKQGTVGDWLFEFTVLNQTPWEWSDYHFKLYNEDFTAELKIDDILFGWTNTVIFQNSKIINNELQFWDPAVHSFGQTADYRLALHLDKLPDTFGIRQIATTTPEPGSIVLLGLGLGGFAFFSRRKRMKNL